MSDGAGKHLRRNFALGVANGVVFMAGSSIFGPALILPQFLSTIFESKTVVGVGSNLFRMGWALLQIVVAYFLRSLKRRKPVYVIGNAVRMSMVGLFVLSFYVFQNNLRVVGILFFVFIGFATLSAGPVGLAYQDIVARVIPAEKRGSYVAYRVLGGQGITALAVGLLVRHILAHPESFPYPGSYLTIFTISWLLMSAGVVMFSFVREPEEREIRAMPRLKTYLLELIVIVKRDHNFRRFLIVRALRICEALAIPFYIVYGRLVLGLPEKAAGTFFVAGIIATLPCSLLWGKLADRFGNRVVIILSCLGSLAAPLIALALTAANAAGFPAREVYHFGAAGAQLSLSAETLSVVLLAPVFIIVRVAAVGGIIGLNNYVMETAPVRRRPLYLGVATSLGGVFMITMPAVGGAMIDIVERVTGGAGYWLVFAASAAAVGGAAIVARGLSEPRRVVARS